MPPKRPVPDAFGDDAATDSSPGGTKRTRTQGGSSAALAGTLNGATAPRPQGTASAASGVNAAAIQAQIAAAKAKIQAQLAASKVNVAPPTAAAAPVPPRPSAASAPPKPSAPSIGSSAIGDIARQVAEAKRLALERAQAQAQTRAGPSSSTATSTFSDGKPSGIHPLLLGGDAKPSQTQLGRAPKFSTVSANARAGASTSTWTAKKEVEQPKVNPYLAAAAEDESGAEPRPKERKMHKGFQFNKAGKYMREAEEARREAQLEALKLRIQESARKAGLDEGMSGEEKLIQRPVPPEAEWWDHALLTEPDYKVLSLSSLESAALDKGKGKSPPDNPEGALIYGENSAIDPYIQHPIPIPAPWDGVKIAPKGVMLTQKEMKKMRKQRRLAEQQDKRDRIKMGLLPPDPPKVKLSNMMKVLASESVADPTKVEARVRREVAARREQHERTNEERKVSQEERKERAAAKLAAEETKGIYHLVFKIKHLVSPSHKFKVRKNALQLGLTGITIFHPSFALVVVEGAAKSIKSYRHLMLNRVNWTDPGRPRESSLGLDDDDEVNGRATSATPSSSAQDGTDLGSIDWSANTCELIFEGPLRERNVSKGFVARQAPTDTAAKELLGKKMDGYWDLAKRSAAAVAED